MNNGKVFERMDVKKAKREFGHNYESVMMLLRHLPDDYDYESITVHHGDSPDNYIELYMNSCYMPTTIALKNGEVVKCLDKWEKRCHASHFFVVPLREIIKDEYVRKVDDFIFFK